MYCSKMKSILAGSRRNSGGGRLIKKNSVVKIARLMFNAKSLLGGDGLPGHYVLAFLSIRWEIVLRRIA